MLSLIVASALAKSPPPPEIKFLSASAASTAPIETLLADQPLQFTLPTRNVKLSAVFSTPIALSSLHIESCEKEWSDGIHVYASPSHQHLFIEGGKKKLDAKLSPPIESVALVFGKDEELCLKNLKFLDSKNQPIRVGATDTVAASVSQPVLFDQHPETLVALEEPVKVDFTEVKNFDRILVWTGGSPLYAHTLKVKGEKGWSETLPLRNSSSDQEIVFRKPFKGKALTIEAPAGGEIGEIRFALKTKVESPHATVSLAKSFEEVGLANVIDVDWVSAQAQTESEKWKFIFRQNGTFFIRGFSEEAKQARDYSAVGSYEIVRGEQNKVRIKLNGVRVPTGFAWDGVSCPFLCGSQSRLDSSSLVTDSILLEKLDEGRIVIRNRTPAAQRTLSLADEKVRRAVDD